MMDYSKCQRVVFPNLILESCKYVLFVYQKVIFYFGTIKHFHIKDC